MKAVVALISLSIITYLAQAQPDLENKQLKWITSSFNNASNKQVIQHESYFITGPKTIEWIQASGRKVYTFDVLSKEGEWRGPGTEGRLVLEVRSGSSTGTIIFSRVQGKFQIEMNFLRNGKNMMPYTFSVVRVEAI